MCKGCGCATKKAANKEVHDHEHKHGDVTHSHPHEHDHVHDPKTGEQVPHDHKH